MTAASYPVTLGGQTFQMSPMTDRDIDEISNWIRSSIIQTARLSLTDDMTQFARDEVLRAAVAQARAVTFGEPSSAPYFRSPEGVARVYFQCVKKNHPQLEFSEFRKLVKSQADIEEAQRVWNELNLPEKKPEAGDGAGGGESAPV
jgi:hypothetical protein